MILQIKIYLYIEDAYPLTTFPFKIDNEEYCIIVAHRKGYDIIKKEHHKSNIIDDYYYKTIFDKMWYFTHPHFIFKPQSLLNEFNYSLCKHMDKSDRSFNKRNLVGNRRDTILMGLLIHATLGR